MSCRQLLLVASACVAVAIVLPASASAALTARYTYAPSKPFAETTTTFDGSASVCDRKPCAYIWRDDGSDGPGGNSTLLGTGSMLYQTFHTVGDKFVRLTVTNRKGHSSSIVKTVSVNATPAPRCNNSQDDDGDGKVDLADPGCTDAQDDSESPDPAPTPAQVEYVAPADGATVSSVSAVKVKAPAGTDWIGVYACGGQSVGEDHVQDADGGWSVDWDTTTCANGPTQIDTWAYTNTGAEVGYAARGVAVSNSAPPPQCSDGINNDPAEDVLIDYPADPGCTGALDDSEAPNPSSSPPVPSPISGQGYSNVFGDEFDTLNRAVWDNHIWYDPTPPAGTQFIQNGVLNLVSRRSDGFQNNTVTTQTAGKTFKYGYYEARMRWTKGNGAWPAFWLFSYRHATNPAWPSINPVCSQLGEPASHCYSGEIDVFEGQGREPNVFYGTIHRNSCSCYGVSDQQNGNNFQPAGADLTAGFHTYGMLWTATQMSWYLDGQLLHTAPAYDSLSQPMFVILQMYVGGWTGGTDSTTPAELKTEVDWVRVWQK
jgi:hypothetical protein